jgi:shikimate kinase
MIIFLIGYAGSGKSSMGKRLARRLGLKLIDTDKVVEQSEGASVADIFYFGGESYFREAERRAVEQVVVENDACIVATGGGLPTWSDNMEWLNEHGMTLYLKRDADSILRRLSAYGREKRPMFRGKSDEELLNFMKQQMGEREAFYCRAHHTIDCTTIGDDEVESRIVELLPNN